MINQKLLEKYSSLIGSESHTRTQKEKQFTTNFNSKVKLG